MSTCSQSVDFYERRRGGRRNRKQLMIPVETRGRMLLRAGFSIYEIGNATMNVQLFQKLRAETVQNQGWKNVLLLLETTGKLPFDVYNGSLQTTKDFFNLMNSSPNTLQARTA